MTYTPTAKSYFSGCGGMDYGVSMAGVDIIQSLEIDKTCCETLGKNFTHEILQVDITKKMVLEQPKSDKQVGNGVAVQVGEWVGNQLMRYFNKSLA